MTWPFSRTNTKRASGYAPGYNAEAKGPDVFDPALRQYPRAYVKGEPAFDDNATKIAYHVRRRQLFEHCLSALASSPLSEQIVLRGSVTLERWFGARARRAKDIDVVVRDRRVAPDSQAAEALLRSLQDTIASARQPPEVEILKGDVSVTEIWTYERAEGRRLVFPWVFRGVLPSQLQVDVVFAEELFDPPSHEDFGAGRLLFASRAESLAWKLLWLSTDAYPQGKDLYDAVLLAESTTLPARLLGDVFAAKQAGCGDLLGDMDSVKDWQVDWENFAREYPTLATGALDDWRQRLKAAARLALVVPTDR